MKKTKQKTQTSYNASGFYKIICDYCNKQYIDQTGYSFKMTFNENILNNNSTNKINVSYIFSRVTRNRSQLQQHKKGICKSYINYSNAGIMVVWKN